MPVKPPKRPLETPDYRCRHPRCDAMQPIFGASPFCLPHWRQLTPELKRLCIDAQAKASDLLMMRAIKLALAHLEEEKNA